MGKNGLVRPQDPRLSLKIVLHYTSLPSTCMIKRISLRRRTQCLIQCTILAGERSLGGELVLKILSQPYMQG